MDNTTLDNSFVDRLKQIVANRYGKNLQIRQLIDATDLQFEKEFFHKGKDLHIPIKVNGNLLGSAILPAAEDLNADMNRDVAQLVRMVLEPAMYQWYLTRREANLEEINKVTLSLENVRLFGDEKITDENTASTLDSFIDSDLEDQENKSDTDLSLNTQIIHLEGQAEAAKKKVALTIHEMTGRWAFVPYSDIKNQLHSIEDIARLGAMTIFIENVETLNAADHELLLSYLDEMKGEDVPLFISSTKLTADELYSIENINEPFVDELIANSFDADRAPLTMHSLKEVIELFFFTTDGPIDA